MIKSFGNLETKNIFERKFNKKFGSISQIVLRKLLIIHAAEKLDDLRIPPANRLEKLKGERGGQFSIRVNDQWRICFYWIDGNAEQVHIVDYH